MNVITIDNLHKHYGDPSAGPSASSGQSSGRGVKAVDGISFEVQEGEIFGFLGPNGAGKTTTIEIIEGYRKPDSGSVTALGLDPHRDGCELKERIGIMLQETALYPDLRVGELLRLFASYYHDPADPDALLEMIGLREKRQAFVRELSGGQRQRLAFILTLINDPELLFLDEPTAGLDPQSRRATWEWIRRGREEGKAVFLTTHYIEEAETLCDRVAIIDNGKIIALDTPERLVAGLEAEHRIAFVADGSTDAARLEGIPGVGKALQAGGGECVLYVREPQPVLRELMALAEREGLILRNLQVEGATLEDVFIRLTGRRIRE
ncbi:MAG: ABC transporter ATP-binding protein [Chloroflexota bacterium]|nr:ABC transporter ATP-binding protein [Chloroflexota bacterium]